MANRVSNFVAHAWSAFNKDEYKPDRSVYNDMGASYGSRPDRTRLRISNERSIVASIYTRICVDFSMVEMRHVRLDDKGAYLEDYDSGLQSCLTVEANIDQAATAFMRDLCMTICDEGVAAVVPVDTTTDPRFSGGYDINTMRVGTICEWFPRHVKVRLYNDRTGRQEEIVLPKRMVAIVENPLYAIMNEPNSTLQRLVRKMNLLDAVDEQSSSGKLDLIIQLPYVVKSETKKQQAAQRRQDLEFQLKNSQYGVAWMDATEKITQLNRPAENNLWNQVQALQVMLYAQLGLTEGVMNGTASPEEMQNYMNRTIEPLLTAVKEEFKRKFLTKTAITQKQSVEYFKDLFKLIPLKDLADIVDKFSRNEVTAANEWRQVIGWKPSKDPKADQLRNSNMPATDQSQAPVDGASQAQPDPAAQAEQNLNDQMAQLGL